MKFDQKSKEVYTMGLQDRDLEDLLAIARSIGWGAAEILKQMQPTVQESRALELNIQQLPDGPVTAADLAVNDYILSNLQASFGKDFAYLTEETYKTQPPHDRSNPFVWIIDPLDGTKDFINGTGEYAVHIALVHQSRPVLAIVACPAANTLYFATLHGGTFIERNGAVEPIQVSQRHQIEDLIVVASRSHRDDRFSQLMQQFPCKKQRQVGSIGGKIAAILEQKADVYISLSGKSAPKDWDLAAPELILTEAGGQFTHFDGSPLIYNQPDVNQWGGLLASNGPCHLALCSAANQILTHIDGTTDVD